MKQCILKIGFILLIVNQFFVINAQNMDLLPNSPIAKDFGFHGKYPIDMFRGTPNISIPIYNTNVSNKNFDISLNYDVKTVKPENIPGWTGLGWNLNLGGAITRIVNGEYDEFYTSWYSDNSKLSYLDNYNKLDINNWSGQQPLFDFLNEVQLSSRVQLFYEYSLNLNIDYYTPILTLIPSPDEFILNILGNNGSFYYNEKGQWIGRTREGRTFTVEHIYKNNYRLNDYYPTSNAYNILKRILYGFNVTMDDGTKYVFGQNDNAIEFNANRERCDNCNFNEQIIPTSWLISEVIFPDGRNIKYDYEREVKPNFVVSSGSSRLWVKVPNNEYNNVRGFNMMNVLYNVYLKKVTSDSFTIEINKSLANNLGYNQWDYDFPNWQHYVTTSALTENRWYKLDNINVKDKNNKTISSVRFLYNNDPTKRLRLEHVEINSNEKYSFQYNTKLLPNFLQNKADSWGYYNGTGFGDVPDAEFAKAETLSQITYPTGGNTFFDYELNDYSKYGNKDLNEQNLKITEIPEQSKAAGGLRIKYIRDCSGYIADCNITTYSYIGDNGKSSGILPYKYIYTRSYNGSPFSYSRSSSTSFQSLKSENNLIGYSKVTETNANGGKKEMYFTNFDNDSCNDFNNLLLAMGSPSVPLFNSVPYASFSLMRGKPLKEVIYSDQKKISTTNFKYSYLQNYIKAYDVVEDRLNNMAYIAAANAHYINFNSSFLSEKETTFEDIITKEKYFYEYQNNNLTKKETILPDNTIQARNYTYADTQYLKDRYMVGIPLTTETTKTINGVTKTLSKTQTVYPVSETDAKSRNTENKDLPLPFDILSQDLQNSEMSKEVTYNKYDGKGNLLQYTLKSDANGSGIPVTLIWGYNQSKPIAKIEGAKYDDIKNKTEILTIITESNNDAIQDPGNNETSLLTSLDNLRKSADFKNYQITTYTYDPLIGVRSITPATGIRENYLYDNVNRLKKIVDINGNIIKEYNYNFNVAKFYNTAIAQAFQKNNCPVLQTGTYYTYNVPAGKYISLISQADADQKAQNEVSANGQNTANINAQCYNTSCGISSINGNVFGAHSSVTQPQQLGHFKAELNIVVPNNYTWYNNDVGVVSTPCNPTVSKTINNVIEQNTNTLWKVEISSTGSIRFTPNSTNSSMAVAGKVTYFVFEYDKN